jgi:protein-disulfide isomerase
MFRSFLMRLPSLRSLISSAFLIAALGLSYTAPAKADITDPEFAEHMKKFMGTTSGRELIASSMQKFAQEEQERQEAAAMEEQFKNPAKIDVGTSPAKGPATAKFTVIEFSDFQCPYCKRGKETMDELLKRHPNDVRVVFKHMPLQFHQQAKPAAKASIAAAKQGKFWEFHDELFANQSALKPEFFEATATKLGLNLEKFKADLTAPETDKQLEEDIKAATANQINGTPGFFVNGIAVRGAYPVEHFEKIIARLSK